MGQQKDLILPGSKPISERFDELNRAGYTEQDGQGNIINPKLDEDDPQFQKDKKRLAPKAK